MAITSVAGLVVALRQYRLLEPDQLIQLGRQEKKFTDPRALAKDLLQRGWLTAYQINQLFQGRGDQLVLGSYVLLERLGEGGMGLVFKARHQKLGRVVALKLIRKERLDKPEAVRRFHREIEAAAKLSHPNIVLAFDANQANETHFYVMEYVDGIDLAQLVKGRGPLPVEQACDYIRQAALGLQHAHEHGLVHRDIKPHNLLLTKQTSVVKVLDMGLARVTRVNEDEQASMLTQDNTVMGTPDYIAPEQARNSREADIRADLYSLGCTFYYLLTGRVPFPVGTLTEKLLKHQLDEPLPLEQVRPGIPPAVAVVVRKLMAKRPEDRYQVPVELAHALTSLNGQELAVQVAPAARSAVIQGAPAAKRATVPAAAPVAGTPSASDSALIWTEDRTPSVPGDAASSLRLRRAAAAAKERKFLLYAGGGGLALLGLVLVLILIFKNGPTSPETSARTTSLAELPTSMKYEKKGTREETILATLRANGFPTLDEGKWFYIGPFPNVGPKGVDTVYPPETEINLAGTYTGKGTLKVQWKEFTDFRPGTMLNLALFRTPLYNEHACIYLYHPITVTKAVELPVSLGSDDTLTVWLNDKRLLAAKRPRKAAPDQDRVTLDLQPGKNHLLIKVCQATMDWQLYILPLFPPDLETALGARLQREYPVRLAPPEPPTHK